MSVFVEIDHVDRTYKLPNGAQYIALKNIELKIKRGEFVSLIGHSGCGKSTLLNMIAGLDLPTQGGVILEGKEIREPGPDRMVVFQNYSLLPWLSVRDNIALAVDEVYRQENPKHRKGITEEHIDLVGLRHAADKYPHELSGGMKQRVAIARALAIRPKLLLLDEPFGALDALTRGSLQEQLMKISQEHNLTCIMVTHDVDEALLLSDRIVMLTNGPAAKIGQILDVPIPRPRARLEVVNHPSYYTLRNEMIYFLNQQKKAKQRASHQSQVVSGNGLEKINLEIGFIPLTDCAPLIIAKEKGLFAKYGLEKVILSKEPSWKAIAKGIASKQLDAAMMVAGMPLSLTLGAGGNPSVPIVSGITLSRNGNAITLSRKLYQQGVRDVADFQRIIQQSSDRVHCLGMVYPSSMQNLLLRYWLASGGIDPDTDVSIVTIPPPQMVASLKAGNLDGFCSGEPWNNRAVQDGIGFVPMTSSEILSSHAEKVLGVREEWAQEYPKTHLALVTALLEACEYCDDRRHRPEMVEILAKEEYLDMEPSYVAPGLATAYNQGIEGMPPAVIPRYHQFYVDKTNCPDRVQTLWMLAEMARWGIIPFPKNWMSVQQRVWDIDIFAEAAKELDFLGLERDRHPFKFFDGTIFNPDYPLDYLEKLTIKRPVDIEEIELV